MTTRAVSSILILLGLMISSSMAMSLYTVPSVAQSDTRTSRRESIEQPTEIRLWVEQPFHGFRPSSLFDQYHQSDDTNQRELLGGSESTSVITPLQQPFRHRGIGLIDDVVLDAPSARPRSDVFPPPSHIAIPSVGINSHVVEVMPLPSLVEGQMVVEWQVADWAAGHHVTSANPGEEGNIVIAGHDDVRGEVFRGLHDVAIGAEVLLTSSTGTFSYIVEEIHYRQETGSSIDDRLATGTFLAPMPEERLTLVTCWPYQVDTHRMIVIAKPKTSAGQR